jgi:sugar O-acyltransferase (sialic acid O-acetyltransferase NeuD family)
VTIPLVIVGAGGFGRELVDLVEAINTTTPGEVYDLIGFVDGDPDERDLVLDMAPLLGGDAVLAELPNDTRYVVAITDVPARVRIDALATSLGLTPATLVHPQASVGRWHVEFGPGTIIGALAAVTTNVRTGRHTHVHYAATIAHDVELGDYVTVSPGAHISGAVRVGARAFIGSGAAVRQGTSIGDDAIIGLGAAVVQDVPAGATFVGVPARRLESR